MVGFRRAGGVGVRFKIASKITPEVFPVNARWPVDIS